MTLLPKLTILSNLDVSMEHFPNENVLYFSESEIGLLNVTCNDISVIHVCDGT